MENPDFPPFFQGWAPIWRHMGRCLNYRAHSGKVFEPMVIPCLLACLIPPFNCLGIVVAFFSKVRPRIRNYIDRELCKLVFPGPTDDF